MAVELHNSTQTLSLTSDDYINDNNQTANNDGFRQGFLTKNSEIKRSLISINISTVKTFVESVSIATNVSTAADNADTINIVRIVRVPVATEMTWVVYSTGNNWGTAGASNTTTDRDATNVGTYTAPTSTGSFTIASTAGFVACIQAAKDAGDSTVWLLFEADNEASINNHAFSPENDPTEAFRPVVTIVSRDDEYGRWQEAEECAGHVHDTKATILVQVGARSFVANDEMRILYGTDPALAGATGTTKATLNTLSAGNVKEADITGLTADTRYYYRVEFSTDGVPTWDLSGSIRSFRTLPTPGVAGTPANLGGTADEHRLIQHQVGHTLTMQVADAAFVSLAAETDTDGGKLAMWLEADDSLAFVKAAAGVNRFPLATDGSGDVSSGSKTYALSQGDADEACRFLRKSSDRPFHSLPVVACAGNHNARHHYHYTANNSAVNDAAGWGLIAGQNYFGLPKSLPTSAATGDCYWTAAEAQAEGQYYAFEIGTAVVCVLDPYMNSVYSTTLPDPLPDTYNKTSDWELGSTQHDFFFHLTTGVIATTTKKNVIILIHNLTGVNAGSSPVNYSWGGASFAKADTALSNDGIDYTTGDNASEWIVTTHPALVSLAAATGANIAVLYGHSHSNQMKTRGDIGYVMMGCPANPDVNPTNRPYDDGHVGTSAGRLETSLGGFGFIPNAGHHVINLTTVNMTFTNKRTYVAGLGVDDPSDGVTNDGQVLDSLTLPVLGLGRFTGRDRDRVGNLARDRVD